MLARAGVKAKIFDVVNSHLVHLHNSLDEAHRLTELAEIVGSRQLVMEELRTAISVAADRQVQLVDVKKLILAMTYGGSAKKHLKLLGCPTVTPWLHRFQGHIRQIAVQLGVEMPEKLQTLREMKKRDPGASLLSYVCLDSQRKTVDKICLAATTSGGMIASFERDCIVVVGDVHVKGVEDAAGVPITVETYGDESAVLRQLQQKYAFMDFSMESELDYFDVARARRDCLKALEPVEVPGKNGAPTKFKFPTPKNTTDFGKVMAAHLEPLVICGEGKAMEYWSKSATCKFGKWSTVADRQAFLTKLTRSSLLNIFRPTKLELEDGKFVPREYGPVPPACKRRDFYLAVAADAATELVRPRPPVFADGPQTREFIQDQQGVIYSFATDSFHISQPSIRVSLNMPWEFFPSGVLGAPNDVWTAPAPTKARLLDLLDRIFAYYMSSPGPEGKSLESDPIFGKPLADGLRSFVMEDPDCKVWHLLLPFAGNDTDFMIWLLAQHTADAAAWDKRTEATYMWGEGGCGKDVLASLLMRFFGDRKTGGYVACFPPEHFVGKTSKSDIKAVLDTAKGARLVINNEVPEHTRLNHDEMKPLTESRGTGITSRTDVFEGCFVSTLAFFVFL